MWQDRNRMEFCRTGTEAEDQSGAEPTKHTPYLALMDELWGLFREYFGEK